MTEKRTDKWVYVLLGTSEHPVGGITTAYLTSCTEQKPVGDIARPLPSHILLRAKERANDGLPHVKFLNFTIVAVNLRSGTIYTIPSKSITSRLRVEW